MTHARTLSQEERDRISREYGVVAVPEAASILPASKHSEQGIAGPGFNPWVRHKKQPQVTVLARPLPPDVERPEPKPEKLPKPQRVAAPKLPKPLATKRSDERARKLGIINDLLAGGANIHDMTAALGLTRAGVYLILKQEGLALPRKPKAEKPPRPPREARPTIDKARIKREGRAQTHSTEIKDRRRFKTVPVPMGDPQILVPASMTGTRFPTRVFDPSPVEAVLKDGSNNSKIGGDVLKGFLRGARIYTLTLEERATCPRSCAIWTGCYGNSMQHARRWASGPALEARLRVEVADLCRTFPLILIRLHVLGDFYSEGYAALWAELLRTHENLHVFGFTAHPRKSQIGEELLAQAHEFEGRHFIRFSNTTGRMGSFTLDHPTAKRRIGDAVVCPEQAEAMLGKQGRHCGNCALCWQSELPIAFVEH